MRLCFFFVCAFFIHRFIVNSFCVWTQFFTGSLSINYDFEDMFVLLPVAQHRPVFLFVSGTQGKLSVYFRPTLLVPAVTCSIL